MAPKDRVEALLEEQDEAERAQVERTRISWSDVPVLCIFGGLFLVVFLQFFTRYVLNDSISWTEEAARYLLILVGFVGIIKCQLLDSHIRLEMVDNFFPRQIWRLKLFSLLVTIGFFGVVTYAITVLGRQTSFQMMVSLPFPKYYLYIAIFVALSILLVVQLVQLVRLFTIKDKP